MLPEKARRTCLERAASRRTLVFFVLQDPFLERQAYSSSGATRLRSLPKSIRGCEIDRTSAAILCVRCGSRRSSTEGDTARENCAIVAGKGSGDAQIRLSALGRAWSGGKSLKVRSLRVLAPGQSAPRHSLRALAPGQSASRLSLRVLAPGQGAPRHS